MATDLPAKISPEGLEIAETYLMYGDLKEAANALDMEPSEVSDYLNQREIKAYIDHQYLESGFRNRNRIADALDNVIELKLEEMQDSEMGSQKDILDILQFAHKLRMEEIAAINKADSGPTNQTNVLITDAGGVNYNKLLGKIYGDK